MLTRDGVKLLDFGLAKAKNLSNTQLDEATQTGVVNVVTQARSLETTKAALTQPEKIVGTLRYASPEQLTGRGADRRSDIFSFGAVVYEMLSGHKAFDGSADVTLIAAILEHEPVPLARFRTDVPPALERLVFECLAKDPEQRWRSAGDIRRQLNALAAERDKEHQAPGGFARLRSARLLSVAVGVGLGLGGLLAALLMWQRDARHGDAALAPLSRFTFDVPGFVFATKLAISMDGRQVAVMARAKPDDAAAVFVRRADSVALQRLEGTDNAHDVFFSPDGTEIGFAASRRLMRTGRDSAAPVLLTELERRDFGATWGSKGMTVFADHEGFN